MEQDVWIAILGFKKKPSAWNVSVFEWISYILIYTIWARKWGQHCDEIFLKICQEKERNTINEKLQNINIETQENNINDFFCSFFFFISKGTWFWFETTVL